MDIGAPFPALFSVGQLQWAGSIQRERQCQAQLMARTHFLSALGGCSAAGQA